MAPTLILQSVLLIQKRRPHLFLGCTVQRRPRSATFDQPCVSGTLVKVNMDGCRGASLVSAQSLCSAAIKRAVNPFCALLKKTRGKCARLSKETDFCHKVKIPRLRCQRVVISASALCSFWRSPLDATQHAFFFFFFNSLESRVLFFCLPVDVSAAARTEQRASCVCVAGPSLSCGIISLSLSC